jgi:hypothetical protein
VTALEARGPDAQQIVDIPADKAIKRRLSRSPRTVDSGADLHNQHKAGGRETDKDGRVRDAAEDRLDQDTPLRAMRRKLYLLIQFQAQEEIEKLTDQDLLAEIATNLRILGHLDVAHIARIAAAKKLKDRALAQAVFADIVTNTLDKNVFEKASEELEGLADQALLAKIACGSGFESYDRDEYYWSTWQLQLGSLEKLTDQTAIARVAKTAFHPKIRRTAVNMLTNQNLLAEIAKNDEESLVREAAIERINDLQRGGKR